MTLYKKRFHDCQTPEITELGAYRWTCPECGAEWAGQCYATLHESKVGRWPRRRTVLTEKVAPFWICDERPETWEPVQPNIHDIIAEADEDIAAGRTYGEREIRATLDQINNKGKA